MKTLKIRALGIALGLGIVSPSAGAMTPINQCGTVITQPGHYELTASLVCVNDPTKPAITVRDTKHVTIHMKGRSITFFLKKLPIKIFPPKYEAPKAIGILATQSHDVEIKGDKNLSFISKAAFGVLARNAEDVKVEDLSLKNNLVGVSYQGPQSQDGKLEDSQFAQNSCDLQVKLGAENPNIDDSNPQSFCQ